MLNRVSVLNSGRRPPILYAFRLATVHTTALCHIRISIRNVSTKRRNTKVVDDDNQYRLISENSKLTQQLKALEQMTKQVKETIKHKEDNVTRELVKKDTSLGISEQDGANDNEVTEHEIDDVFKALGISDGENDSNSPSVLNIEESKNIDRNENVVHNTIIKNNNGHKNENEIIDLNNENELMTIFPTPKPYVTIPESVKSVLTPKILSNITQKETSNWEPVVDALLASSICDPLSNAGNNDNIENGFTGFDFHKFVSVIPRKQKEKIVEKLHELALLSGILWGNVHVMNDLLALCNLLPTEKAGILVDTLIKNIKFDRNNSESASDDDDDDDLIVANITTKAILLNHYARMSDVNKVRQYIADLNELPDAKNPMKTSPVIYTSIMQMYMRLDNYELARETFDTMKFLSLSTSPSPRTYTSMILLDTLHNNIEHGVSVYEEMIEKDIKIEPDALLALAKGCGARHGMVSQGWDFIIKYYENGYAVDSQVMEIMMYLAYVDGDLPFVRGIWMNICETNTKLQGRIELPHGKCTKWLFNTYYKIGDIVENVKNGKRNHVPVGLVDSRVKSIRTKVLELTNFKFHEDAPPLLPLINFDGSDSKLMLSEARAIWKYLLMYERSEPTREYISDAIIEAYLYVVGRYALLKTFENEWFKLTFFDNEGIEEGDKVSIEEPSEREYIFDDADKDDTTTNIVNNQQTLMLPVIGKTPRTDRLYNMCMHIARHQGSLSFAQDIWVERGKYRKSTKFQKKTVDKQDDADFKFARLMLSVLTHTGNVGDAYKLVLSSQNRFVWTRYHLKSLLMLCERLGYTTFAKELVKVVKRGDKWFRRQKRMGR